MSKVYILYDYEDGITILKVFYLLQDAESWKYDLLTNCPNRLLHIKEMEIL